MINRLKKLIPMLFVAVGFLLPQQASAWGSGGFVSFGFTHTKRVMVCTLTSPADGGNAALEASVKIDETATATLTSSKSSTECALFDDIDPQDQVPDDPNKPIGGAPANFALSLTYEFSALAGGSEDKNHGHGNDCAKVDLDNPGSKKKTTITYCSGQSSVTCEDNGDTSTRQYSAFCEQSTEVYGTLKIANNSETPEWLREECNASGTDPEFCILQFGKGTDILGPSWVLDDRGNVDMAACATIFPEVLTDGIATGQVLSFLEEYGNATCSGDSYIDPLKALYRNCDKDSFDPHTANTPCNPVLQDDSLHFHGGVGETTQEILLAEGQWNANPTIQLKCDEGTDSGVIPTELLDSATFSTARVVLDPDVTPVVSVDGDFAAGTSPLNKYGILTDADGAPIGLKLDFLSCREGVNGVAQLICKALALGDPTDSDKATVTLRISGSTGSTEDGVEFTGISLPVNVNGTSNCQ
jgi:hypothetical protein